MEHLAKQGVGDLAGDQDELHVTLDNDIGMQVFPWPVVRDHRDEVVALMASDNFDHGHGLADSELSQYEVKPRC